MGCTTCLQYLQHFRDPPTTRLQYLQHFSDPPTTRLQYLQHFLELTSIRSHSFLSESDRYGLLPNVCESAIPASSLRGRAPFGRDTVLQR